MSQHKSFPGSSNREQDGYKILGSYHLLHGLLCGDFWRYWLSHSKSPILIGKAPKPTRRLIQAPK